MSRRSKKTFPPGTFIPTPQRLVAIGHLCLAFSLMLWYLFQPFMGEYFMLRSRMLLYEYAMGTSEMLKARPGQEAKLERQALRFKQLPEKQREMLQQDYRILQNYAQRPVLQKIEEGVRFLIQKIPPFEQAWIFFSITIAILILLKIEGAKQAAWLLPLITLAYALDNQWTGKFPQSPSDYSLFPTEETLIRDYLTEPFATTPLAQKQQLEKGWQRYLIDHWSYPIPSSEEHRGEEAEFNFTIARLSLLHNQPLFQWIRGKFHERLGWLSLFVYFLWNILFVWIIIVD